METKCIFCGVTADSEEDAFPKWLIRRFPYQPGTLECQRSIDATATRYPIKSSLKICVKCVCQPCNTGWMSVLQSRGKPVIERLLDNPTCTLSIHDCKTVSLWAVMTTMVLEALNESKTWRFSDLERTLLSCGRNQVPGSTYIWIAKRVASPGPSYISHLLSKKGESTVGAVTTFGFGTLAFQVLKVVPGDMNRGPVSCRTGPWDKVLLKVWPPQSEPACWPPRVGIQGDIGMEELEMRFSPPGAASS